MHFVCVTALRREVVIGARWSDINERELFIRVRPEIDKRDKPRFKPLTPQLLEALKGIRVGEADTFLFPWVHGQKTWYEVWNRTEKRAGLKLGLHDLKRFSGELALRAGVTVLELQQHMDHANIQTTLNHYVRPTTTQLVSRIQVPLPDLPPDPVREMENRVLEADRIITQRAREILEQAGIDVDLLQNVAKPGEIWLTSSGTKLRLFNGDSESEVG